MYNERLLTAKFLLLVIPFFAYLCVAQLDTKRSVQSFVNPVIAPLDNLFIQYVQIHVRRLEESAVNATLIARYKETIRYAKLSHPGYLNCSFIMNAVLHKRQVCMSKSKTEAEMMLYFSGDHHHIIPYLIHYFSLGYTRIYIFNNDANVAWYSHPMVLCFLQHQIVELLPWFGEGQLHFAQQHFRNLVKSNRGYGGRNEPVGEHHVWLSFFDVDELLLLHHDECISTFLDSYPKTAELLLNWAFYLPEVPLTAFGRSGKVSDLSLEHLKEIDYTRPKHAPLILLPHDMLLARLIRHSSGKGMARLSCFDHIEEEHFVVLRKDCPYGQNASNVLNNTQIPAKTLLHVEDHASVAQLNHYWTVSAVDFARKIHRGIHGQSGHKMGEYASLQQLYTTAKSAPMVNDTSFVRQYGEYFNGLKVACPQCFDLSLFHNQH